MGRKINSDVVHTADPNSEVGEMLPVFLAEDSYQILHKVAEVRGEERCKVLQQS